VKENVEGGPTAAARDRLQETMTKKLKGRSPLAEISGTIL
jgi:hypothetical protein